MTAGTATSAVRAAADADAGAGADAGTAAGAAATSTGKTPTIIGTLDSKFNVFQAMSESLGGPGTPAVDWVGWFERGTAR